MASSSANSHILSLVLFLLLLPTQPATSSVPIRTTGFRATLTRAASSPNNKPIISSSIKSSSGSLSHDVYVMSLAIGTPPVKISAIMDTGSDLIWTKCNKHYSTGKSKSLSKVTKSCGEYGLDGCKQEYQDKKTVSVILGQETFTIGNRRIPNVTFACGKPDPDDVRFHGIVGLGRGELSLVSQLNERVFSYCLGSPTSPKSVFLAGSEARSENTNTKTTPLIKQDGRSYYYVSLEGISVGATRLPVTKSDFAISSSYGYGGGMIIDSGTTFTYIEKRIIDMITDELVNQTKLERGPNQPNDYKELQHCFKSFSVPVPKLVFHFEGADWELARENYIHGTCLAFIANDQDQDKVSIFGNWQQQNMMVIYDLDKTSLSFKRADCNGL